MDLNLQGKIAVVTGSDSGIGLETAKILAAEGANIVLSDKTETNLEPALCEVKEYLNGENTVVGIAADITKNKDVMGLSQKVKEEFGGAHIVVHSAGARGACGDFLALSDDDWMETIQVDLMGAVRVSRAFIPQMQEHGWGRLILVSSENAFQPYRDESPYNACKAAIINLSKHLSRTYSKENILMNCVSPAFIKTPMTEAMLEELSGKMDMPIAKVEDWFAKNHRPHIAMQRRGRPDEVASVIVFLCSERASFINGSNYRIDGGSVESAFG